MDSNQNSDSHWQQPVADLNKKMNTIDMSRSNINLPPLISNGGSVGDLHHEIVKSEEDEVSRH